MRKTFQFVLLFVAFAFVFSACNKGGGCEACGSAIPRPFEFFGLTSALSKGGNSVEFRFPTSEEAKTISVECKPTRGGEWALMDTVLATATSMTTDLPNSGVTFTCRASAVGATYTAVGDKTLTVQTVSLTSTTYKGPLLVQAYGDAPTAPTGTPNTRQVSITWVPFTGATATTNYSVVRTAKGGVLDTTITTACTGSTSTSCLVCNVTNLTTCTDTAVGAAPAAYDYTVVLSIGGMTEETPSDFDDKFRITVPIPPSNMILVHRDSVNYEECMWMGLTPDPALHQRCTYTGLGASPKNSSPGKPLLGLSANYYDFGYHLFMDRWNAGCKWTTNGSGAPAGGSDGNVYYDHNSGDCYVNHGGTWKKTNDATLPTSHIVLAYTNAPTAATVPTPPMVNISQSRAWDVCSNLSDPNYGAKRLMRRRESVAAAAWPYLTGEPGALSDAQIVLLQNGTNHPVSKACNANSHNGVANAAFGSGSELARNATGGPDSFMIGSLGTSKCVSRFGAQDLIGQVSEHVSDQIENCNGITNSCTGRVSTLDSGNNDWQSIFFNGTQLPGGGGVAITNWPMSTPTFGAGRFSMPTGLPFVGTDNGNSKVISGTTATKMHTDEFSLQTDNRTVRVARVGGSWSDGGNKAGRFTLSLSAEPTDVFTHTGFRCVVPAE